MSSGQSTKVSFPDAHFYLCENSWDTKLVTREELNAELITMMKGICHPILSLTEEFILPPPQ